MQLLCEENWELMKCIALNVVICFQNVVSYRGHIFSLHKLLRRRCEKTRKRMGETSSQDH